MPEDPKDQNVPFNLDKLLALFVPKLVDWGVPGGLIAIALLRIRDGKPEEAPLFFGLSVVAWIVLRIGNQLAPRFEKLLDWSFNNGEKVVLDTWARFTDSFEGKYYERLKFDCREYENRGINRGGLQLANVFVPLKLSEKEARRISQNLIGNQQFTLDPLKQQEIGALLVQMTDKHCSCPRLAILGAPGSGKSTLLRHLALMYATRRQRSLHPKAPKLVPVLLQLRDIYPEILNNPEIPLVDVITTAVKNLQKSDPLEPRLRWFAKRLRDKTCLVMLDGLDEIADDEHRQQISQWVDRQIRDYRTTPFILTSRPEGYRTARLQENVIELEVQPFDLKQRNDFIKNWYFHRKKREYNGKVDLGVKDSALRQAEDLIAQIENSLTLRLMATNPLLLNMIAIAHEDNRSLSTRRVDVSGDLSGVTGRTTTCQTTTDDSFSRSETIGIASVSTEDDGKGNAIVYARRIAQSRQHLDSCR
jgi:energy-coupling factor transporter ATP-binding protein EcfA2